MKCEVRNCGNSKHRNPSGVTFHRFPANAELLEVWAKRLKLSASELNVNKHVCSAHFKPEDIRIKNFSKTQRFKYVHYLVPGALPTDLREVHDVNDAPMTSNNAQLQSNSTENPENTMEVEPEFLGANDSIDDDCEIEWLVDSDIDDETSESWNINKELGTPSVSDIQVQKLEKKVEELKKKNHALHMQVKRRDEKIAKLQSLSFPKNETAPKTCDQCKKSFSLDSLTGIVRLIVERILERNHKEFYNEPFDEELKFFATQLHFISPKAYRFVRKEMENVLPSEISILRWLKIINCEPGFSHESLNQVQEYVSKQNTLVWCQLLFDEMHIQTHIDIVEGKVYGFSFLGVDSEEDAAMNDDTGVATQVLVFMLVAADMQWKVPIGYFPIHKMDATEKSRLISKAISLSESAGVKILGITFDGAPVNISAIKILGCDIGKDDEQYYTINHVHNNSVREIYIHPDPCHMLKLVRNHFSKNKLVDRDGGTIDFKFIEMLYSYQTDFGAGVQIKGNKLTSSHIHFAQNAMNVELAAQLLSNSVAEAIDFCRIDLKLKQFEGSEATTNFLRICNAVFDVLNSQKDSQERFKAPIQQHNREEIVNFCETASSYFTDLQVYSQNKSGNKAKLQHVTKSHIKTGFVGLRACLRNLPATCTKMEEFLPTGLHTYSLLQDHLEFFFGEIRTKLGCNTSPTIYQFRAILKRLLLCVQMGNFLESTNCKAQLGVIPTLHVKSGIQAESLDPLDTSKPEDDGHNEEPVIETDRDDDEICEGNYMSEMSSINIEPNKVVSCLKTQCEHCVSFFGTDSLKTVLEDVRIFGEQHFTQRVKYIGSAQFLKTYKEIECITYVKNCFKNYASQRNLQHFIEQEQHLHHLVEAAAKLFSEKRIRKELRFFNSKVSERQKYRHLTHFKGF